MELITHSFKVGSFNCTALSDGTSLYAPPTFPPPATLLFVNAPPDSLQSTLAIHGVDLRRWSEWESPYICLLVDTGEQLVLIDTGMGTGLSPQAGRLRRSLASINVAPEDIDLIVLTHAHPDHVGGITLDDGKLAFPSARYAIARNEWEFWTSGEAQSTLDEHMRDMLVGFATQKLSAIQDRVGLFDGAKAIVPGIVAIPAPGHTPGHSAISVMSEGDELMYVGDAVLHPLHIEHPEWVSVMDTSAAQTIATRRQLFGRAASENALVLAFHFPFPGLGRVRASGSAWSWQAVE